MRRTLGVASAIVLVSLGLLVAAPLSASADSVVSTYSGVGAASQRPSMAVSADGSVLYVANGVSATVSVIDTSSGALQATIAMPGQANTLTLSPDGATLYVGLNVGTNTDPDSLVFVDTAARAITGTPIPVGGDGVSGIAVSPNGATLYVPVGNANLVDVIDTATRAITQLPNPTAQPRIPALTPDGTKLYVSHFLSPAATQHVTYYDLTASPITAVDIPIPGGGSIDGMTMSPDGAHVYFTQRAATSRFGTITTATNAVTTVGGIGSQARGIAVTLDGTRAYVANTGDNAVAIIDLATSAVVATVPVAGGPQDITISPDGRFAYSSNSNSTVSKIAIDFAPTITTTTLPGGAVGTAYSSTVAATGFPAPTFTVTGTLPPGLSIDPTTGAITGTPTTAGSYSFTITAANTVRGTAASDAHTFTIVVAAAGTSPAQSGGATLAQSGVDIVPALLTGASILLLGTVALGMSLIRRRRRAATS